MRRGLELFFTYNIVIIPSRYQYKVIIIYLEMQEVEYCLSFFVSCFYPNTSQFDFFISLPCPTQPKGGGGGLGWLEGGPWGSPMRVVLRLLIEKYRKQPYQLYISINTPMAAKLIELMLLGWPSQPIWKQKINIPYLSN